jgi:hypothetical protein
VLQSELKILSGGWTSVEKVKEKGSREKQVNANVCFLSGNWVTGTGEFMALLDLLRLQ